MLNEYFYNEKSVDSKRVLYTPSAFAKEDLLHLQETGTLTALNTHKSQRTNLESYLCFVILDGKGFLTYDGIKYDLSEGDCVFIDCSKTYSHETGEDFWTLKWIHFYGNSMKGIYNKYCERGGMPVFRPSSISTFISVMDRIYNMAVSDDHVRDMHINELLSSLLTTIMENSWFPENQTVPDSVAGETLTKVKEYIEQHYSEKLYLENLSERFYINKFYLMRLFKSRYGDTILGYHNRLRIASAKELLRFSDKSIEEIGYECGYEDANYFSRSFKKIEGKSPSVYRKNWREK